MFTTTVEVTSGRPCYEEWRGGLKINKNQSIASFVSRAFPHPIKAQPHHGPPQNDATAFDKVSAPDIAIGRGEDRALLISFMRTVRVPEDKKSYDLPPGFGAFPVFNIRPFSPRLPLSMVAQGGLFIPMYRKCSNRVTTSCLRHG